MKREWESAARTGDAEALAAQIADGADPDALDRYGQTALMLAAVHGHSEVVRVLIDAGAKLDVTAKYRLSATMLAVINHRDGIVRALAAAGADLSLTGLGAPGFADKTAADLARARGAENLATELEARAD